MYDVSPDGANSSTKVDLSRRVIRLSGNSTPGGQSVTSNSAGGCLHLLVTIFFLLILTHFNNYFSCSNWKLQLELLKVKKIIIYLEKMFKLLESLNY